MLEGRKTDNLVLRLTLETIQKELGTAMLRNILNNAGLQKYIDAFPPDNDELVVPLEELHRIQLALFEMLGYRGSQGLMTLIGKEISRYGVEKRPKMTSAFKMSVKLFPESKKIKMLLNFLVKQSKQRYMIDANPGAKVVERKDAYLFIHEQWHTSEGLETDKPVCSDLVGMIRYLVEWITGNKHEVKEIECRATGDKADVVQISKEKK